MSVTTWLPPEVGGVIQPYSMGPLVHWFEPFMLLPPRGTIAKMDGQGPTADILTCLIAPRWVQLQAQARGERAIMMVRVKGLRKALGYIDDEEGL